MVWSRSVRSSTDVRVGLPAQGPCGTTDKALRQGFPARSARVKRKIVAEMANKAVVGEKVGMTQVWDDQNRVVPVTVVKVTPLRVVQVKRPDTDGYSAVQVTYGIKKVRSLTKPESGHFEKGGVEPGVRL